MKHSGNLNSNTSLKNNYSLSIPVYLSDITFEACGLEPKVGAAATKPYGFIIIQMGSM